MCPYPWYQVMRLSKDKRHQRYQMVMHAKEHGIKQTAKDYDTTPKTTRKWFKRFKERGYQALADLSRRPLSSPRAIPNDLEKKIVALRAKYKRVGADQVKTLENLPTSPKTIRKIWRKNNEHLEKYGLIVENGIRQTDNGSEYIGSWSAKEKRPDIPKKALMLPPVDLDGFT